MHKIEDNTVPKQLLTQTNFKPKWKQIFIFNLSKFGILN
jgi:hypothetical protein